VELTGNVERTVNIKTTWEENLEPTKFKLTSNDYPSNARTFYARTARYLAEILHQRLGYTFEHNEPLQSPDEENMPAEVNGEVEIYHSPERLIRIASLAEAFSWVVLVFFLLRFAVSFYEQFQLQFLSKSLWLVRPPSQPWLELLRDGSSLMAGIFFALVLQAVAQIIYLGMDIYEEIQLIPRQEDLDSTEQETRE
jgi:hypothetical protein